MVDLGTEDLGETWPFKPKVRYRSKVLSTLRRPDGSVPLDAFHQPLYALFDSVSCQAGRGQHHAIPSADGLGVAVEDGLDLPHPHAVCKASKK